MNAVYGKDCASFSALISDLEKATSLLQTKVLFRLNCLSGMHGFCFGSCGWDWERLNYLLHVASVS